MHSIYVNNLGSVKPFGTIDTPGQGETVSGTAYINFGWVLTKNPRIIPKDGSTITVTVDGQPLGHPTYNQFRSDIATAFPGLANSDGAVGYFFLDTTKLTNGLHSLGWLVYDDGGVGEGIGSRFINVQNPGHTTEVGSRPVAPASEARLIHRNKEEELVSDDLGEYPVEIEELERIELQAGVVRGRQIVNGSAAPLPPGISFDGGTLYWQTAPGLLGDYHLTLERPDATEMRVRIRITPQHSRTAR